MTPRLKEKYKNEIVKNLMSKMNQKNIFGVPRIKKIVVNMGLGADGSDKKILKSCIQDLSSITGQLPLVTKFKKSISNFKSRKGTDAGLKVTLRNDRMFEFLDRLVNIALPRIKDFRGLADSGCDKFGNYSFGKLTGVTRDSDPHAFSVVTSNGITGLSTAPVIRRLRNIKRSY